MEPNINIILNDNILSVQTSSHFKGKNLLIHNICYFHVLIVN